MYSVQCVTIMRWTVCFSLLVAFMAVVNTVSSAAAGRDHSFEVIDNQKTAMHPRNRRAVQPPSQQVDPSLCKKQCQNNGVCVGPNKCFCGDGRYGGDQCELPINVCDMKYNGQNFDDLGCVIGRCNIKCKTGFLLPNGQRSTTVECKSSKWVDTHTNDKWESLPVCRKQSGNSG